RTSVDEIKTSAVEAKADLRSWTRVIKKQIARASVRLRDDHKSSQHTVPYPRPYPLRLLLNSRCVQYDRRNDSMAQNDPTIEPSAMTATSATRAPTMPTITMSR